MSILDISKTLMYEFHYNYMKKKYSGNCKLLMTDTDSLMHEVKTGDFYPDIKDDISEKFDTSIFQESFNIPRCNKKVPRLLKDDCGGKICSELVGLKAKSYSYKMCEDGIEEKRCKGV